MSKDQIEESGFPLLSRSEVRRIHRAVDDILSSEYDREFISDTIVVDAWIKGIEHVSYKYIRNKCISAFRQLQRERDRNKNFARMIPYRDLGGTDTKPVETIDRKILVEEAVSCLGPYERRLVWMKFYSGQTLEEIAESVESRREDVQRVLKVAVYKMRVHLT